MKKLSIFFAIIIIIIVSISYMYMNYKIQYRQAKKSNGVYEQYYQKEIYGVELTTSINRAIDNNIKKEVKKDEKGNYIDNQLDSIQIEIKMIDDNNIYNMEKIYNKGMDKFLQYYSEIKFKCVNIKYHTTTNKIKYMLFEQITQ